jgi:hypothetical protein
MSNSEQVRAVVRTRVQRLIAEATDLDRLSVAFAEHRAKIHFIPTHYRVLGGVLHAMNIKFGNFLEGLLSEVARMDPKVRLHSASGSRLRLTLSAQSDALVDSYITARKQPHSPDLCDKEFWAMIATALSYEKSPQRTAQTLRQDVDLLFVTTSNIHVYAELKYNDDHDTGKFVDINRKFIKTYLALCNHVGIHDSRAFKPVIYYFNPEKRWGPMYVPSSNIYRGSALFDAYFATSFEDVERSLREMSDDPTVVALFDELVRTVQARATLSARS